MTQVVVKGNWAGCMPANMLGTGVLWLALCGAAAPAHAQTGQIVNAADGLCLQVNGAVAANSRLQTARCVANAANQTFTRTASNELRIAGSLCVDAYGGGKQAAEVGLWGCQGSPNERWAPNNGFLVTENNFCMAVDGGNRAPGTRIIVYTCINDPSQKWSGPAPARAPAPAPVAPPTPPPAPVTPRPAPAPTVALDPGNLSSACQMLFGRDCSVEENAYVRGAPAANWVSRESIMAFLRTREVVGSASIRDAIVTRAIDLTYSPGTQVCTEAWTFLRAGFTTNTNNSVGSTWNSFQQLYYAMNGQPAMLRTVVTAQCKGAAPRVPGTPFDVSIAQAACQSMLGRACQADESAQIGSAVGGNNRDAMQNFIRDRWISASQTYKDNVIARAFADVMAGKTMCTEELQDLRARFFTNPTPGTTWSGYYGLAYAANGQPALVQARSSLCVAPITNVGSATLSMIASSYQSDFGRAVRQDELTAWAAVKANDPRVANRAAFQQADRNLLKTNAAERDSVINLSYNAAYHRAPVAEELATWRTNIINSGNTYEELVAAHRDYLVKHPLMSDADRQKMVDQSYASAFGRGPTAQETASWKALPATDPRLTAQALTALHRQTLKTNATERFNMITRSYQAVFRRDPAAGERAFWDPQVQQQGFLYDQVVTQNKDYLAKNPPPPPTPVKPVTPVTPVKVERVEQCFGAVGKGCEGSGASFWDGRSDLVPMARLGCSPANNGYRNCWVVPGSIKHDNCCHANPNGKECGGNDSSNACANEWEMACNDVVHGRAWTQAVPDGPSDLTPVASPQSRVPGGERRSTAVLCAPGGSNISVYHTAAFCCSGRFKETWQIPWFDEKNITKYWGVCADAGSYGLQSVGEPKQWNSTTLPGGPSAPPPPPTAADIQKARNGGK